MNIRFLIAAAAALLIAVPASAQSSFVMVIGEFSAPRTITADVTADPAILVEQAADRACARPFMRDLKAQVMYRDCLTAARAQAVTLIEQRAASAQLALR